VYESQGRSVENETLHKQGLALQEKKLGVEHPYALATMHGLADVYVLQDCHKEAEELYHQLLAVHKKQLGTEHPDTLTTIHSLANVYTSQERYADAEQLYGSPGRRNWEGPPRIP
jgi:Tetratricopeptide repeat